MAKEFILPGDKTIFDGEALTTISSMIANDKKAVRVAKKFPSAQEKGDINIFTNWLSDCQVMTVRTVIRLFHKCQWARIG